MTGDDIIKKLRKRCYAYTELEPHARQYDDLNLEEEISVAARYIPAELPCDKGNPFIEALPRPRDKNEIIRAYMKPLQGYCAGKICTLPASDRIYHVAQLRELRFPLPFHAELEYSFYAAMMASYRVRYQIVDEYLAEQIVIENKDCIQHGKLVGDAGSSANAGFALLGCSGCGKSSAIKELVSICPQVIIHRDETYGQQTQITYLVVNCIANSNFAALYVGIGAAIDRALGNTLGTYQNMIQKKTRLAEKAEKVRELVELFAIGMIILDEIQLIDFASSRENSYESLLTLVNRTKVAIAVVGTEDAYGRMFTKLRTARRIGNIISGNQYCENKQYFGYLVQEVFRYQWFDTPQAVTNEITQALYSCTHGIIDQLIGIYQWVNIDYLMSSKKPTIDADFIRKTANKHFMGIQAFNRDLRDPLLEKQRREMMDHADEELQAIISTRQEDFAAQIINTSSNVDSDFLLLQNVIRNIQYVTPMFSDAQITHIFHQVLLTESDRNEQQITHAVMRRLTKKPESVKVSDTNNTAGKTQKPDPQQMLQYILSKE